MALPTPSGAQRDTVSKTATYPAVQCDKQAQRLGGSALAILLSCYLVELQSAGALRCGWTTCALEAMAWGLKCCMSFGLKEPSTAAATGCTNMLSTCNAMCSSCRSTSDFSAPLAPWITKQYPHPGNRDSKPRATPFTPFYSLFLPFRQAWIGVGVV